MAPSKTVKSINRRQRKTVADQPAKRKKGRKGQKRGASPSETRADTEMMREGDCPYFLDGGIVMEHDHFRWVDELMNNDPAQRRATSWLRVANSFCFIKPDGDMADIQEASFLVAWAAPLTGGARKVCRALSGYTPPRENLTDSNTSGPVWRMQTEVIITHVSHVYATPVQVLAFERNVTVAQTTDRNALYILQNPHPDYVEYWESSFERYGANRNKLVKWSDVSLDSPRPDWFNDWSWQMLRMEEGYPARHPEDPAQRADLRSQEERRAYQASRANATEPDPYEAEVDEVGLSDASSIELDHSADTPTGRQWRDGNPRTWDPTRRSPTPRSSPRATPPAPTGPQQAGMSGSSGHAPFNTGPGGSGAGAPPLSVTPTAPQNTIVGPGASAANADGGGQGNSSNAPTPRSTTLAGDDEPSGEQQPPQQPALPRSTPSREPFSLPLVGGP